MIEKDFLDFIIKVQTISKIGMVFSKDPYALENYEELNTLSLQMLENFTNLNFERPSYFTREIYPTPNVSVRTIIFNDKQELLLVQEANSGQYSLPGGWCDLYDSPSEAAIKECQQEAGVQVKIKRLVGIMNRTPFKSSNNLPEYVILFEGEVSSDLGQHTHETLIVDYFPLSELPEISRKVTSEELKRMIAAVLNKETIFD